MTKSFEKRFLIDPLTTNNAINSDSLILQLTFSEQHYKLIFSLTISTSSENFEGTNRLYWSLSHKFWREPGVDSNNYFDDYQYKNNTVTKLMMNLKVKVCRDLRHTYLKSEAIQVRKFLVSIFPRKSIDDHEGETII